MSTLIRPELSETNRYWIEKHRYYELKQWSTCIMANTTNPRRNAEGYSDPTAYEALKNIEREEDERFHRLLHTLFYLCELADFEIEGRIILVDKRNGRVWR